ncbi:MAG: phosphate/phosphite/phosphonate ABC transporter substrate-binding protein [Bacteriovoracaceae bacterium]|nr:phosphate/phosphite/phosphonate ABC transporter substrate-binding protein [Bacteroidota bacterium]
MSFFFTVSPDFSPLHISDWFLVNTWLQRNTGEQIHLELFDDFESQRKVIEEKKVDLIYSNPYDAAILVRKHGFKAVARPRDLTDEAIIAVAASSPITKVEDLKPQTRIATTDDPNVHMMAMILIEPADLSKANTVITIRDSYMRVAQDVIGGIADVGFFLKSTYDDLSDIVKKQLRPITTSRIYMVHHALLVGNNMIPLKEKLQQTLVKMSADPEGKSALEALSFSGWDLLEQEDVEFMIDLMDTLVEKE